MFVFTAPTPGSGKSKLAGVIAIAASGHYPTTMAYTTDEEEQRKRILALLMRGNPIISMDNVGRPLSGDAFCTVLTESTFTERVLGESRVATAPTTTTWLATGNGVQVEGDLQRRVLFCRIDPGVERPEDVTFPFDPVVLAQEMRPELVTAGLTLLRAHHVAGRPTEGIKDKPFGSYESFSEVIRGSLVWAGQEDPLQGRLSVDEADSHRDQMRAFLQQWNDLVQSAPHTVADILSRATHPDSSRSAPGFVEVLKEILGVDDLTDCNRKIGKMLKTESGRIYGCFRIRPSSLRNGVKCWRVERAGE